jgi:hypothetical protein
MREYNRDTQSHGNPLRLAYSVHDIYLRTGGLPEDKADREPLCHRAEQYTLVNDELFRRGANGTVMKCITLDEGCAIL